MVQSSGSGKIKNKKPEELKIAFHEEEHKYIREDGAEYNSVSSVIDKLIPYKDWVAQCKKSAKAAGVTYKELWDKWEEKKNKGREAGTLLHEKLETETNNNSEYDMDGVKLSVVPSGTKKKIKWSSDIKQLENNTIYTELMIYDHKHRICGQADEVVVKKSTIIVLDFKTDAEIKKKGYEGYFGEEKLSYPCAHLGNCNFNKYSLKMSLYMYMLWKANPKFKIGKLLLKHYTIKRDVDGVPVLENGMPVVLGMETIEVPYRKKEVELILKNYEL